MTLEELKEAKQLENKIVKQEKLLYDTKNQHTEWIDFSFGNGSNRSCVCDDKGMIETIKDLLISHHERKIKGYREELRNI